jgi:hypothetical protein
MKTIPVIGISLALGATLLGGCASTSLMQATSAGYTGCQPQANQISNVQSGLNTLLWNASCQGKTYLCSAVTDANGGRQVSCAPAVS